MDQLELLKQQWNKGNDSLPKFNTEQLTSFIAKRSSSIVKWIFYIALIEFSVFTILNLSLIGSESQQHTREITGDFFYYGSFILHYVALIIFFYLFYMNYKNISVEQPTRSLMKNILRTRKTMKWYIWYNLIYIIVFTVAIAVLMLGKDPLVADLIQKLHVKNVTTFNIVFMTLAIILAAVLCGIIYLIYSLIYGILLRKLERNYEELKKMELS